MFNNLEDIINIKVIELKQILEVEMQYLKWKSHWMRLTSNERWQKKRLVNLKIEKEKLSKLKYKETQEKDGKI